MALFKRKSQTAGPVDLVQQGTAWPTVTAEELAYNYKILGYNDGVVIVTRDPLHPKQLAGEPGSVSSIPDQRFPQGNWLKSPSPSINRVEYNLSLRGEAGRKVFDQMRRSDGSVRMSLNLLKTPILAGRWFIEPFDEKLRSQTIADFVWWNLTEAMSLSWIQFVHEALCEMDFGFYAFEKVWRVDTYKKKQMMCLSLEPRHPLDVYLVDYDDKGRYQGLEMWGSPWDAMQYWLPGPKSVVFTYDGEAGEKEGISVLRSAYKHWYYAENFYKIDGIQKERHGIGIPVIQLPIGFSPQDLSNADEMGRNLRTNEKAHVVLPPNWTIMMLDLQGNPVDALVSAQHHVHEIAKNVLAQFVDSQRGLVDDATTNFFLKNSRHEAEMIAETMNKEVIPEMVDLNYPNALGEYPKIRVRRIGDTADWRTISFAIRNLVGAGVIRPDDPLEAWFRDEMDLSPADPSTTRQVAAPQAGPGGVGGGGSQSGPPEPGPPKQSPAGNMQQQAQGTGKANAGQDNSGSSGQR